jgi:hypothetical protein
MSVIVPVRSPSVVLMVAVSPSIAVTVAWMLLMPVSIVRALMLPRIGFWCLEEFDFNAVSLQNVHMIWFPISM